MENSESPGCRLIINWDTANMWNPLLCYAQRKSKLDADGVKHVLRQIVAEHAKAKVDRVVHCGFVLPWGTIPPGFQSFDRISASGVESSLYRGLFDKDTETGMRQLEQAGYDFFQVLLEQSHKQGLEFLFGMRMNDLHGGSTSTPFYRAHPEWHATGPPSVLDYKHPGLRETVLAVARESLERYEVDGIELDWMRWCHAFDPSEAERSAPILTDFTNKMRGLLDQAARRRGCDRLLLGVRVPQTIEECRILGFDLQAWVRELLVDYVCPSDFAVTDNNTETEEFVAVTHGTQCKVYPSVHPQYADSSLRPTRRGEQPLCHTAESYRAAAKNFYAFGAHGVSAYNFQDPWVADPHEWPRAMSYLAGLRSPAAVAQGDRHYLCYPASPFLASTRQLRAAANEQRIVLNRMSEERVDSLRFRMAEDLGDACLSATLIFKVAGMAKDDQIEVSVNGSLIPASRLERTYDSSQPPNLYRYRTPLSAPPARFGDNELRLRLTKSAGTEQLIAQDVEVLVRDAGTP